MRARLVDTVVVAVSAIVVVCCSSGSYSEAEGAEGGPCYGNGTCDANLVCASGRCVVFTGDPDASTDDATSATDTGASETAADDAGVRDDADAADGDGSASCVVPASPPPIACEGTDGGALACGTTGCCVDDARCDTSSCSTSRRIVCMSDADCSSGGRCCVEATLLASPNACTLAGSFQRTLCRGGNCTGAEIQLCSGQSAVPCEAPKTCKPALLRLDFGDDQTLIRDVQVGLCQ